MPVYVQHEVLGKVRDVFNAESIWQAPGLALFARRPLLRELLERSPRELRGRAATRCFSHVTLLLAQEELDDDRHLNRGARVRDLAESLTALHRKDFGDLLGGDEVRYDVVGTEALAPGEVEVKFGHAVYLPKAGESILYQVRTSRDGDSWQPACPIYLHQRLALLGQDAGVASCAVPGWPFGADGAILLVNDGADAPIEVQVRPRGLFDHSFDEHDGIHTITRRGVTDMHGEPLRMLMKVERCAPAIATAPKKAAAVWKARAAVPATDPTAVPLARRPIIAMPEAQGDATFAPLSRPRVTLTGLALPRLSRYRDTGAIGIDVALDGALQVAAEGHASPIGFGVDGDDRLHVVTAAGREPVSLPASFDAAGHAGLALHEVAPAMAERYCATLLLPHGAGMAVAAGARLVFGRAAPMLSSLRVLDSPRFLRTAEGAPLASADRIGLSRNAFSFEAVDGGYRVARMSASQDLFHLDAALQFVAVVEQAAPDQSSPDKYYFLPHGHHLVAGHYILRFDA